VVLVKESAGVAKNFCALELATTSALRVFFCLALGSMDSEDSGPGPHQKRAKKRNRTYDSRAMGDRRRANLAVVGHFDFT